MAAFMRELYEFIECLWFSIYSKIKISNLIIKKNLLGFTFFDFDFCEDNDNDYDEHFST